ncbi:hypothetical protein [Victivallis vadensis]|uniref:hypothetical protein n=1 Tax=Victivallis vadensis TaxID=172901 RepID=UPI0023F28F7F|nr:hypothetical protein [Victivallis vadensis]
MIDGIARILIAVFLGGLCGLASGPIRSALLFGVLALGMLFIGPKTSFRQATVYGITAGSAAGVLLALEVVYFEPIFKGDLPQIIAAAIIYGFGFSWTEYLGRRADCQGKQTCTLLLTCAVGYLVRWWERTGLFSHTEEAGAIILLFMFSALITAVAWWLAMLIRQLADVGEAQEKEKR